MTIPPPLLYDPNVPENPPDFLATSQPDIQTNFQTLFDAFLKNHVSLNAATLAGNHTIVELLQRSGSIQTDIDEFSVYTKNVEGQTDQLFMRFQDNGTEFQFTNYQIYPVDPSGIGPYNFFTFLPGKLIAYFGSFNTVPQNTLPNGVLNLVPPVAKVIASIVTCPITTGFQIYKPNANPLAPINGFTTKIQFTASKQFGAVGALPPCHYIIIAQF